jgi:glycosyltransferase involved in cell wall biosynthesis
MRIAINLAREYVGGITSSNINLMNYLYGQDYEFIGVELTSRIYMKGPVMFRSFAPEVFDHHIVNIHHLPIMEVLEKSSNLKQVETAYREAINIVRGILRETNPDVVLLSGTYYLPWIISVAAEAEKIPVVLWYSGVLARETVSQPEPIKSIFKDMEKSIVQRASRVIFPSDICKDVVEKEVTKKKIAKSFVIPNPISSIFTEPCATESSMDRRIAAVGRYSRIKNFDRFFELHKTLLKRKWSHTASFVTNTDFKIKKLPKTLDLLPPMTPEGLKKYYLTQGLVICPSSFETFGNVPMEAACLGIPVLVSETMGCAEILKQVGLGNMVISFDDINQVADRAQQLCGQYIMPKQLNMLKRLLDHRFIGEEIRAVLHDAIKRVGLARHSSSESRPRLPLGS